tara:strand:+ start:3880 stop:4587 length:708 start_codon:yes stop_codon:yes gene_type:complete
MSEVSKAIDAALKTLADCRIDLEGAEVDEGHNALLNNAAKIVVLAETLKVKCEDINEMSKAGYSVTEEITWKPGDPVTNTGEAMLAEEASMNEHGVMGTDGRWSDARYTAPELAPAQKEVIKKTLDIFNDKKEGFLPREMSIDELTIEGPGGKLLDSGEYWWRGMPVNVTVSWVNGVFTFEIFRTSDNKKLGMSVITYRDIVEHIERDDDHCRQVLGVDYGHMFSCECNHSDTDS